MSTITSRATDYGLADVSCTISDVGIVSKETSDVFMGPATLTCLTVYFHLNPGGTTPFGCYLKVYDALRPEPTHLGGLGAPLWIIQCHHDQIITLSFPDGYAFTNGITLRATRTGGTGTIGVDAKPDGLVKVDLLGRK